MVGVNITRVAAKAARRASAVLGIRVIFPTSVFQRMILLCGRADVGIADTAMLFHGVLRIVVLIILRACAVATVLIFSTTAAIVASAIPAMLAGRVPLAEIFPSAMCFLRTYNTPPFSAPFLSAKKALVIGS